MATDLENLVVSLEANLKQYEKELARAQKVTVSQLRAVEREAQRSTASLEKRFGAMGVSIRGALAGALAGLSVAAVTAVLRSAIDHMDELSKASQKIGIPVEELSKLEYAGKLADVALNDLQTSMAKFSKSLAEIQGGTKNSAGEALKAIGISATDANGALRPTPDILADIAEKFASYQDGANKTALAIALFGKSGAELIPLLNGGADGLRAAGDEAERLGIVIDTQTAQAAERLNDNLTRITSAGQGFVDRIVGDMLPAISSLSDELVVLLTSADASDWTSAAINDFLEQVAATARSTKTDIDNIVAAINAAKSAGTGFAQTVVGSSPIDHRADVPTLDLGGGARVPNPYYRGYGTVTPGSAQRYSTPAATIVPRPTARPETKRPDAPVVRDTSAADAAAKKAARDYTSEQHRKADAIKRVTDALALENANLKTNELQQRINTEIARAGVSATSEQGKAIADLVTKNYNLEASQRLATQATANLAEQMQATRDAEMALAEMGVDAFERIAFGGEKAKDILIDLVKQIAVAGFQAALLGKGPLGDLFGGSGGLIGSLLGFGGSSFAGFYANGGQIPSGMVGIAGEAGRPELIEGPATVTPLKNLSSGGGGAMSITINLAGANGDQAVARLAREAVTQGLREYDRQQPKRDLERSLRVR